MVIEGASVYDSGDWVVLVRFGLRWVTAKFDVIVGETAAIAPSLNTETELPIHVEVKN